jgi:uncharacterized membrane protein
MNSIHFTQPAFLWLLIPTLAWVWWCAMTSEASIIGTRKWISAVLRTIFILLLIFGLSGFEWRERNDSMNVLFVVDRSLSIPQDEQEKARIYANSAASEKRPNDRTGVIVFGADAGIELMPNTAMEWGKYQAVIDQNASRLGNAVRLATAAFPEGGQKKLVLLTDGNTDHGDAREAVIDARTQDVTVDVIPLGAARPNDVVVKPLQLPSKLKKNQAFNIKSVIESTVDQQATMRVYRNGEFIAQDQVPLTAGENVFSFQENLEESGFYEYEIQIEAENDDLVQNNQSFGQTWIQGDPSIALVTNNPLVDRSLLNALEQGGLKVSVMNPSELFVSAGALRFYDGMILSNIPAGQFSRAQMGQLESLVKDFGMGMVIIGGDDSLTAGSYRGTPLEDLMPLSMELDSRKVIPRGALALIMHGMEFMNGNEVARQMALGTLNAMGSEDELGVLLWDGTERWLFPLERTGNKASMRRSIAGMNQGDLPHFQGLMELAYEGLLASDANLKHVIVFSDGDPSPPTEQLMRTMREANITVSTVLIAGHATDANMVFIAEQGNGQFYNITNPNDLPQVFLQETAVILKSAIMEETFVPELVGTGEPVRGLETLPSLDGYVATTPKERAAIPILSSKGDPIFAYWNYGLGRTAVFTSDAGARWASAWVQWDEYARFWQQVVQWSLRKLESSNLDIEVVQDGQDALILIEALDEEGDFQNFLDLEGMALKPEGESVSFPVYQVAPGQYRATVPMAEQGSYQFNILEKQGNEVRSSTTAGASLSYSPEFQRTTTNSGLLSRIAEWGGGILINPDDAGQNPFLQGRRTTYSPKPMWENLLAMAILLWLLDIGVRRIDIDRAMVRAAVGKILPGRKTREESQQESRLASLRKTVSQVKEQTTGPGRTTGGESTWVRPSESTIQSPTTPTAEKPSDSPKEESRKTPKKKDEVSPGTDAPARSTSRLLEARRKAKGPDSPKDGNK